MRTTTQAATDFVDQSELICTILDRCAESSRLAELATRDNLIHELRRLLRQYAYEVIDSCEGELSSVRTTLKYEAEDLT